MLVRAITGAIFVAVLLGTVLMGIDIQIGVFSVIVLLGLNEFYRLFDKNESIELPKISGITLSLVSFLLLASYSKGYYDNLEPSVLVLIPFFMMFVELWRKKQHPFQNISIQVLGIVYLVLPFYLALEIKLMDERFEVYWPLLASMLLLIWTNDTFAYLTGKFFGKTKLFERISPKKTWEGTIGGIAFTILLGFLLGNYVYENITFWVVSSIIIALGAIFGDLIESMLKRSLNIKDSGSILPGHGGILDRFDATLFTIPFFFAWIKIYYLLCIL